MKKIITILLIFTIMFLLVACNDKTTLNNVENNDNSKVEQNNNVNNEQNNNPDNNIEAETASREDWEAIKGSFVRDDSSQYNNAVLQMKYLSNDCVMFEFRLK